MPPAARITDNHVCPKVEPGPVPHVGGPILTGHFKTFIGWIPASRVDDKAFCVGPPDTISKGSSNVIIGDKQAARICDSTEHGGIIVTGCPTVLIGETPQSSALRAAAASGAPFCEECEKALKAAKEAAPVVPPEGGLVETPQPAPWVPAGSVTAKTAADIGLQPSAPGTKVTPYTPTPEERELAASPGNTLAHREAREKVVRDFYERYTGDGLDQARADQDMGVGGKPPRPNGKYVGYGIDLSLPLQVVQLGPPQTMAQYVNKSHGYPGNFFDPIGNQTGDQVGLNADPKIRKSVTWEMPVGEGLFSGNGPVIDDWTDKENPLLTQGGGVQITVPNSVKKAARCVKCKLQPCKC
ncbi:PAAR domain-containing protein [Polyangium aurulentum]|uniref:PAAR domain-containing protein n=1 Tax=Polyangium aurulentum TaxID=2567896 RepID=UPI0010AE501C|nr:PAAR domain-containing protein [Polyangium aurulentum]UQA62011.1 PAAR domain-containing protein [Polyangium aurulentum]